MTKIFCYRVIVDSSFNYTAINVVYVGWCEDGNGNSNELGVGEQDECGKSIDYGVSWLPLSSQFHAQKATRLPETNHKSAVSSAKFNDSICDDEYDNRVYC